MQPSVPRWPHGLICRWGALALIAAATTACSSGQSRFADSADERAHRAGTVMVREKDGTAVDMVRRVVGGDPATDTAIEALVADGDWYDGRIVLRITERADNPSQLDTDPPAVRCYEYLLPTDAIDGRHIDCPNLPAMAIPEATPPPTIPDGIQDTLLAALQGLAATGADEEAVRRELAPLAAGVEVFEVTTVADDGIGVVFGNGDDECVSGRITVDEIVEVWRVPAVIAQPGELGCSAASAASGFGKESPH